MTTWLLILIVWHGGEGVAVTALPWPYESRPSCIMAGRVFVAGESAGRSYACVPAPEGT